MSSAKSDLLRHLPSVDRLLQHPELQPSTRQLPRAVLLHAARAAVQQVREELLNGAQGDGACAAEDLTHRAVLSCFEHLAGMTGPHYRRAVNATGIILHTGLGRAVLPRQAIEQIAAHLAGYSMLQVDVETGERSRRDARIEWLLQRLTGAEAATVLNNNAAATVAVLHALAAGHEVIVSRGQLVEIGGSFRLPEVMAASGARLVEVGTTNKTHARDYEAAINENTAAIMRVHPSNYKIVGFTAEVPLETLVEIARRRGIVVIDDVGAGALLDLGRFGFPEQATLPRSVQAGADIITCSADKLIGASQGGLVLGRAELVQRVRKSPLARVLRVGKLTLAALEATLALFLDKDTAFKEVPTLRMLQRSLDELDAQADRMARALRDRGIAAEVADGCSQMGSGSLPGEELPTRLVRVSPAGGDAAGLSRRLRRQQPPVIARVQKQHVLIDPRTLLDGDEEVVLAAVCRAAAAMGEPDA